MRQGRTLNGYLDPKYCIDGPIDLVVLDHDPRREQRNNGRFDQLVPLEKDISSFFYGSESHCLPFVRRDDRRHDIHEVLEVQQAARVVYELDKKHPADKLFLVNPSFVGDMYYGSVAYMQVRKLNGGIRPDLTDHDFEVPYTYQNGNLVPVVFNEHGSLFPAREPFRSFESYMFRVTSGIKLMREATDSDEGIPTTHFFGFDEPISNVLRWIKENRLNSILVIGERKHVNADANGIPYVVVQKVT